MSYFPLFPLWESSCFPAFSSLWLLPNVSCSLTGCHHVIITWYYNNMMLDALYIYSQRYVITSYTHGSSVVLCVKVKSQECHHTLSVGIIAPSTDIGWSRPVLCKVIMTCKAIVTCWGMQMRMQMYPHFILLLLFLLFICDCGSTTTAEQEQQQHYTVTTILIQTKRLIWLLLLLLLLGNFVLVHM